MNATQELASKNLRSFRSFLLVAQFEAQEIGERISEARTVAGLTQEQLAEMASFSKRSLQDYEAGVTIPYKHMREISRLLDRPVAWFLHGEEESARAVGMPSEAEAAIVAKLDEALERLERLEQAVAALPADQSS